MLEDRASKFIFYSIGIVVEDKDKDSIIIEVTPIEDIPTIDNMLYKDFKPKYEIELPDSQGVQRSAKVEGRSTIKARWLPISNSNRTTAPDVIKNETVMIYRYADSEEYFWNTMYHEPKIRRLEKVKYAFGNKKDPLEEWDDESSFWVEVSTFEKEKWVHMKLAKYKDEKVGYDVKFDCFNGKFRIEDTEGNYFELLSVDGVYTMWLNKDINITSGRHILIQAPSVDINGHVKINGITQRFD